MDQFEFEPDTPETALVEAAIEVAAWAPLKQRDGTTVVEIPWVLIHVLRERLETLDVDWRLAKRIDEERRARR